MSKAFVNPREWDAASAGLTKGRGGYQPSKKPKPVTREEHRDKDSETPFRILMDGVQPTTQECTALMHVVEEIVRTHDRAVSTDPVRRTAIVAEEAGEALKEALDETRGGEGANATIHRSHCRMELIQTAAAAVRAIGQMDREEHCRLSHKSFLVNRKSKKR